MKARGEMDAYIMFFAHIYTHRVCCSVAVVAVIVSVEISHYNCISAAAQCCTTATSNVVIRQYIGNQNLIR